jgi:putative PIN family toxin of toxin-antitoxin system
VLIVLDTNVLVAGLINPFGSPARVLDQVVSGTVRVAFDDRILDESIQVLKRPAFGFSAANISALIDHIKLNGIHVVPEPLGANGILDQGDLPFAEVAVHARVDALVTGNLKHFQFLENQSIPVLAPSQFMDAMGRILSDEGH